MEKKKENQYTTPLLLTLFLIQENLKVFFKAQHFHSHSDNFCRCKYHNFQVGCRFFFFDADFIPKLISLHNAHAAVCHYLTSISLLIHLSPLFAFLLDVKVENGMVSQTRRYLQLNPISQNVGKSITNRTNVVRQELINRSQIKERLSLRNQKQWGTQDQRMHFTGTEFEA